MKEYIIDRPELRFKYVVYSNGDVYNLDTNRKIKPSKDKRRPNEPAAIYFKKKDDKRFFIYHDELMARLFIEGYDPSVMSIIHLDGNVENCSVDNLFVKSGITVLREVYHETKEWVKIDIGVKLYFDYYICEDGRVYNGTTNSFIKPFEDKRVRNEGYLRHNFYIGKTSNDIIHFATGRLVALHFIPKPKGKDIVLYNDGDFRNVDKSNLSWGDNYDVFNRDVLAADREFTVLKNPLLGKEKWKPVYIPGHVVVDDYLVSNFGRVYNKSRGFYCTQSHSDRHNANNQYWRSVAINTTDKNTFHISVHRLVAFAFLNNDDPDTKILVNHINGNPECNFAINLEWCSPYENLHHAIETNLCDNSMYKNKVTDKFWRLNTFYAWIYSVKGITDSKAYNFYNSYRRKYNDDLPELSFDEFIKTHEDKLQNDDDFKILNEFYKSNYSIDAV